MTTESAKRYNSGKPRYDYLEPDWLLALAKVAEFGASKYGVRNYRKGLAEEDLVRAILSHTVARMRGETMDAESGLPHASHAAWNALELMRQHDLPNNPIDKPPTS